MGLPKVLKDMMLFNEANAYVGECNSVTLPKLTRKLEEWRAAGMDSPIKIDMGGEALDLEFSCGGPMRDVLAQYGIMDVAGVLLRFAGAYQDDQTGDYVSIEVEVNGRHEEIDMGEEKTGEQGEFKVKTSVAYYKLDWNGATVIEIDPINMVLTVDGVDRLAARRDAIGL